MSLRGPYWFFLAFYLTLSAAGQSAGLPATTRPSGAASLRREQRRMAHHILRQAEAGKLDAELRLAELYYYGIGVAPDHARVLYWYNRAAAQGSARAELRLGDLYRYGLIVSPNPARAAAHDRRALQILAARAARNKRPQDDYALGMISLVGRAGKPDPRQALHWFHLAAAHNHIAALLQLGALRTYGFDGIAARPARARYWFRRAARHGSATAAYTLAWMYRYGIGARQDSARAGRWYRRALKLSR